MMLRASGTVQRVQAKLSKLQGLQGQAGGKNTVFSPLPSGLAAPSPAATRKQDTDLGVGKAKGPVWADVQNLCLGST